MILIENAYSDVRILVLARPSDSARAVWIAALRQWGCPFLACDTVYEAINAVRNSPSGQAVILIVRPAMLGPQTTEFVERYCPNLQILGWIDSGENVSDCAIAQTTANGIMTVSHLDQLWHAIHRLSQKTSPPASCISSRSGRLEYELSEDEVNALMGVE